MWFSGIACMWCFTVGAVVSTLTGAQDPKKLNPALISPGLYVIFAWWPRPVRNYFRKLGIGDEYVSDILKQKLRKVHNLPPHD